MRRLQGNPARRPGGSLSIPPGSYFKELTGDDREQFLKAIEKGLDADIAAARKDSQSKLRKYERLKKKLNDLPKDQAVYDEPKLVENRIWRRILKNPENLKRISIVSCMPDKVAAYYPEFQMSAR